MWQIDDIVGAEPPMRICLAGVPFELLPRRASSRRQDELGQPLVFLPLSCTVGGDERRLEPNALNAVGPGLSSMGVVAEHDEHEHGGEHEEGKPDRGAVHLARKR